MFIVKSQIFCVESSIRAAKENKLLLLLTTALTIIV